MRLLSAISLLLLTTVTTTYGWSKKGHDVVCYIAECNLTKEAATRVDELLEGRSMVYYSSWLDNASYTPEYDYTKTWHYINMNLNESVEKSRRNRDGDLLSGSEQAISILRDGAATHEEASVALKILIHLVGDMHQPMHVGRLEDRGGGTIPVVYFTESTSLHSAWDYNMVVGAREWSYTEWQQQLDRVSPEEMERIVSGEMVDWINATHVITKQVYRDTPAETRIFYDYMSKYTPIVEQQLLYAGLRLAYILNGVF